METKKVYIIDRLGKLSNNEELRKLINARDDVEIIFVQDTGQIPLEIRLKEEILREEGLKHESLIEEINEIKMLPRIEELCRIKPTHKGHERPYKYHR